MPVLDGDDARSSSRLWLGDVLSVALIQMDFAASRRCVSSFRGGRDLAVQTKAQRAAFRHGSRRLATASDTVAAPRSNAEPEALRAITPTVLLLQADASSSIKRVEEVSDASARSPCRTPGTAT